MDSYVSREDTHRKPGQPFGTSNDARLLRAISARANATRRMGSPQARGPQKDVNVKREYGTYGPRRQDRVA